MNFPSVANPNPPDPHVFGLPGSGSRSRSISQRHGSADPDPDPDPHQRVMDPHDWIIFLWIFGCFESVSSMFHFDLYKYSLC